MEDRSGVMTFCLGLTVIVLAAVALSMVVEKRFHFSDKQAAVEKDIREGQEELDSLRATLAQAEMRHQELLFGADNRAMRQGLAAARQTALLEKRTELDRRKTETQADIARLESRFTQYREDYRKVTWEKAVGESIPALKTRSGREFLQSVIAKVTRNGLEIRHEHGYARIPSSDLSNALQDRFQWE